jgi:hypothetical protein
MAAHVYGTGNPELEMFVVPEDTVVWRYMDIPKYLDILMKKALWFTRAIELRKLDLFEGEITPHDTTRLKRVLSVNNKEELRKTFIELGEANTAQLIEQLTSYSMEWFQLLFITRSNLIEHELRTTAISCWHANKRESDAMWSLYAQKNAGIAIRTTVANLLKVFGGSSRTVAIGKVNYDSQDSLSAVRRVSLSSLFIKRHAFVHENEIRLIADLLDGYESPEWTEANRIYSVDPSRTVPPGVYVNCEIIDLMEEVIASPLMPNYIYETLRDLTKMIIPEIDLKKSNLLDRDYLNVVVSDKLGFLLSQYRATGRLLDFGQFSSHE